MSAGREYCTENIHLLVYNCVIMNLSECYGFAVILNLNLLCTHSGTAHDSFLTQRK